MAPAPWLRAALGDEQPTQGTAWTRGARGSVAPSPHKCSSQPAAEQTGSGERTRQPRALSSPGQSPTLTGTCPHTHVVTIPPAAGPTRVLHAQARCRPAVPRTAPTPRIRPRARPTFSAGSVTTGSCITLELAACQDARLPPGGRPLPDRLATPSGGGKACGDQACNVFKRNKTWHAVAGAHAWTWRSFHDTHEISRFTDLQIQTSQRVTIRPHSVLSFGLN